MNKGFKHSEGAKEKMREAKKGKPSNTLGKHWKIKDTSRMKGHIPWNKGIKSWVKPWLGKKRSKEDKKKMSDAHRGKVPWIKGKKHTAETRLKMSLMRKGKYSKEKAPNWKGGIAFEPYSYDWTETLRRSIRERDKYICQLCGKTQIQQLEEIEQRLAVHHIDYNKKNCNPDNLITLCLRCNSKVNSQRSYWTNYFYSKSNYANLS